jgi:hypothetical protein
MSPIAVSATTTIAAEVITATSEEPNLNIVSTGLNSWTVRLLTASTLGVGHYESTIKFVGNQGSVLSKVVSVDVVNQVVPERPLGALARYTTSRDIESFRHVATGVTESYQHAGGLDGRLAIVLSSAVPQTQEGPILAGNMVEAWVDTRENGQDVFSNQLILATLDLLPATSALFAPAHLDVMDLDSPLGESYTLPNVLAYEPANGDPNSPSYILVDRLQGRSYAGSELLETSVRIRWFVRGVQQRVKVAGQAGDSSSVVITWSYQTESVTGLVPVTYTAA